MNKKTSSLDVIFSQLETIIEKLDQEQLSVSESLAAFESGLKLTRKAQKELQEAEQRVMTLTEKDGEPSALKIQDQETQ